MNVTVCLCHCHRHYLFIVKSVCCFAIHVTVLCDCRDWRLWMMAGPTYRRCGTQNRVYLHRATNSLWVIDILSVDVVLCQCIHVKTHLAAGHRYEIVVTVAIQCYTLSKDTMSRLCTAGHRCGMDVTFAIQCYTLSKETMSRLCTAGHRCGMDVTLAIQCYALSKETMSRLSSQQDTDVEWMSPWLYSAMHWLKRPCQDSVRSKTQMWNGCYLGYTVLCTEEYRDCRRTYTHIALAAFFCWWTWVSPVFH